MAMAGIAVMGHRNILETEVVRAVAINDGSSASKVGVRFSGTGWCSSYGEMRMDTPYNTSSSTKMSSHDRL